MALIELAGAGIADGKVLELVDYAGAAPPNLTIAELDRSTDLGYRIVDYRRTGRTNPHTQALVYERHPS